MKRTDQNIDAEKQFHFIYSSKDSLLLALNDI